VSILQQHRPPFRFFTGYLYDDSEKSYKGKVPVDSAGNPLFYYTNTNQGKEMNTLLTIDGIVSHDVYIKNPRSEDTRLPAQVAVKCPFCVMEGKDWKTVVHGLVYEYMMKDYKYATGPGGPQMGDYLNGAKFLDSPKWLTCPLSNIQVSRQGCEVDVNSSKDTMNMNIGNNFYAYVKHFVYCHRDSITHDTQIPNIYKRHCAIAQIGKHRKNK
jgi:hypothetical protein